MKRRSTVPGWLLLGLLGAALGQGCSSSSRPKRPTGSGATSGTAGKDPGSVVVQQPSTAGMGGESPYDPLCGIPEPELCVPDDTVSACKATVVTSGGGQSSMPVTGPSAGGESGARSAGEAGLSLGGAPASAGEGPAG